MTRFNVASERGHYAVASLDSLIRSGNDPNDVFEETIALYESFPEPDTPGNDYGEDGKWEKFMQQNPRCFHCLIYNDEKIVGYWSCLPVTEDLYNRGVKGENINESIGFDDIDQFSIPDDHYLYLVDLFRYDEHYNATSTRMMIDSFVNFLLELAESGYFVRKIFANISGHSVEKVSEKLGFSYCVEHKCHQMFAPDGVRSIPTKIYELDLSEHSDSKIFEYCGALKGHYLRRSLGYAQQRAISENTQLDASEVAKAGETEISEFKSTLRRDLKTTKNEKYIENSALKTICAFLNTRGGTLLIGVDDEGAATGLEADGFADEDSMSLHLVNLIKGRIDDSALGCVQIGFSDVDGARVMIVQCQAGTRPTFLKVDGTSRFFIRTGTSTNALEGRSLTDYVSIRF